MSGTLTPDGARLLRLAREEIVKHPENFSMANWECRTYACIGGHVGRLLPKASAYIDAVCAVSDALGFGRAVIHYNHPLYDLFFQWPNSKVQDVVAAAERINAFLWSYGFPPEEVAQGDSVPSAVASVTSR